MGDAWCHQLGGDKRQVTSMESALERPRLVLAGSLLPFCLQVAAALEAPGTRPLRAVTLTRLLLRDLIKASKWCLWGRLSSLQCAPR